MWKKLATAAIWVIIGAVVVGSCGAELESRTTMRVANGAIALGFALLAVRAAVRPKTRVVTLVICGLFAALFGYLIYNIWPMEPVYSVIGVVLDWVL